LAFDTSTLAALLTVSGLLLYGKLSAHLLPLRTAKMEPVVLMTVSATGAAVGAAVGAEVGTAGVGAGVGPLKRM